MISAAAVSGVATVEGSFVSGLLMFTVVPGSASGTGTIEARPIGTTNAVTGYEPVYDDDGNALTLDISSQISRQLTGRYAGVRVTSSNTGDTFDLVVS